MKIIVACDRHWGIGNEGDLLVHISADLKRFKDITVNNIVVYGRKTLATFPSALPLPNRINIILTRNEDFPAQPAYIVNGLAELFSILEKLRRDFERKDVYVIGGSSVYEQLLPYCDEVLLTLVDAEFEADSYFPDLDQAVDWSKATESPWQEEKGLKFRYLSYQRKTQLEVRRLVLTDASPLSKLGLPGFSGTVKDVRSKLRSWNREESGTVLFSVLDHGNLIGIARLTQPVLNSDWSVLSWQTTYPLTASNINELTAAIFLLQPQLTRLEIISARESADLNRVEFGLGAAAGGHYPAYLKTALRPDYADFGLAFIPFARFGYILLRVHPTEDKVLALDFWRHDEVLAEADILATAEIFGLVDAFGKPRPVKESGEIVVNNINSQFLRLVADNIRDYLRGDTGTFPLQYELTQATDFQRRVWQEIAAIPYGRVATYEQIAAKVAPAGENHLNYARAVGHACSSNPLPLIIPCHRVIGKDRSLVGFSGGVDIKDYLLNLELQHAQKIGGDENNQA
ncbi:MAG TPA: methylated-DNA--[protein]-cysteine S-methyltransferase [Clostridiaceae bacterium]|nr:methylated-DNA--[protein]-cysteine S-methyltransferase [Clostridiaceae bacterium]